MKAAIISLGSTSSQWIAEALKRCFDEVENLSLKDIEIEIGAQTGKGVLYKGKPLKQYDCVYAKGSFRYSTLLRAITTQLKKTTYMPTEEQAFTRAHDKLLTHLKLQEHGVPMPKTYIVPSAESAKKLLKKVTYPIIIKMPSGTHGKGVMFADSSESAITMIDTLALLKQPFLIQEYVETEGKDIRAFVVGEKVVAAMQRSAGKGDKRANLHSGGEGTPIFLEDPERKIAIQAAQAMQAEICGVDMLKGPKGPLVIEINISPGLQGITKATKINIAEKIASYLYKKTREFKGIKTKTVTEELKELIPEENQPEKELITTIDFRGERILLPKLATTLSKIKEGEEIIINAKKGKIEVKKK
ncbi:RimK family alpha-L-glutamate ligase [Candidatus Woesearchaeota archaeon]|nr:RimK family alpha-L-glutamate ligase [Candidatus Woesearchaeota archaeon]